MSDEFAEFHEQGFDEARQTLGDEVVTIDGDEIKAVINLTPIRIEPADEGGATVRVQDLYVTVKKTALADPPPVDAPIIHNGVKFTLITAGTRDAAEPLWEFMASRFIK